MNKSLVSETNLLTKKRDTRQVSIQSRHRQMPVYLYYPQRNEKGVCLCERERERDRETGRETRVIDLRKVITM